MLRIKHAIRTLMSLTLLLSTTCIAAPIATITNPIPTITSTNFSHNTVQISYSEDSDNIVGINTASYDTNDIYIIGPNGAIAMTQIQAANHHVTYMFSPPGGAWSQADNGSYQITLNPNQIFDNAGVPAASQTLASFEVNIDTTKPIATVTKHIPNITLASPTPNSVQIQYTDADSSIDTNSFDTADITITGNTVGALTVIGYEDNGSSTVTYTFAPPGGAWAQADNDTYVIKLVRGQVSDQAGNTINERTLSTFDVNIDTTKPTASVLASVPNITVAGPTPNTVKIQYTDTDSSIDNNSFDQYDITITGLLTGTLPILSYTDDGTSAVTYTFAPPGGSWDQADNDTYEVNIASGEVSDLAGNTLNGSTLLTFEVNIAPITDNTKPSAEILTPASNIDNISSQENTLRIQYNTGLSAIDPATIDAQDLSVSGCKTSVVAIDGNIVTYSFLPADNAWGIEDSGLKTITLHANEISDQAGNQNAQQILQSFVVNIPTETWSDTALKVLSRDIHIANEHELSITHSAQLEIASTDGSQSGQDTQLIEFTVSGTVLFDQTSSRVDAQSAWHGFTILNGGYIDFGNSQITGDIYVNQDGTLNLNSATIHGNLQLSPASIFKATLDLENEQTLSSISGSIELNGQFELDATAFTYNPENSPIIILENDGANLLQGTFNGLPEGALVTHNNYDFRISYVAGDGNDIALTLDCGVGQYASLAGCAVCTSGHFCPDNTNMYACSVGRYAKNAGQTQCDAASPGYFVASEGAIDQQACTVGRYQNNAGTTQCIAAPPGTYIDSIASTAYSICTQGTYQPDIGQNTCLIASVGSYVDINGANSETACPEGTTSNEGAQSITDCFDLPVVKPDNKPNKKIIKLKNKQKIIKRIQRTKAKVQQAKFKKRLQAIKQKLRKNRKKTRTQKRK